MSYDFEFDSGISELGETSLLGDARFTPRRILKFSLVVFAIGTLVVLSGGILLIALPAVLLYFLKALRKPALTLVVLGLIFVALLNFGPDLLLFLKTLSFTPFPGGELP